MQFGASTAKGNYLSWKRVDSSEGSAPEARSSCSICYHYDSKQAFMFGGKDMEGCSFDNRIYSLTTHKKDDGSIEAKWKVLKDRGNLPGYLSGHSSVCVGDNVYIFGGKNKNGLYLNSMHQMDIKTNCWTYVKATGQHPQPRSDHAMTYIDKRIYVFGGEGESGLFNDLFLFDVENNLWHKMPTGSLTPNRRCGAALLGMRNTNDDGDLLCLVFGSDKKTLMDDMFTYSCKTKEWYKIPSRGQLRQGRSHFLSCLLMAGKLLMFGGLSTLASQREVQPQSDSFVYVVLGGSWTQLQTNGPEPVPTPRSHMAGFKLGYNTFVVYGGLNSKGKTLGDLWYGQMGT